MKVIALWVALSGFLFANVSVTVSIVPQKYFVKKIAGEKVEVSVMVHPGDSPATYEPSPKQMADLAKSDIYFAIGVPFEKRWLPRFQNVAKETKFVDVAKGVEKRAIDGDKQGNNHLRNKDKLDPHIWLNPKLVKS